MFPSSGFGSSGGFGGQQNTGFGSTGNAFGAFGAPATGFGAATNTGFGGAAQTTGFGAAPATGGFGATPASTGFGGGGFGGSSTGFGVQAQNQPQTGFGGSSFGAAPATSTGGFGGFGASSTTTGGFGSTSGFGAKPAISGFGTQPATGFGAAPTTGFGGATTGFGSGTSMLGGGLNANQAGNGTVNPPFTPHVEKDLSSGQNSHYQSITAMPAYRNFSFEELRLQDYQQGRKFPGQAGGFGAATTGFGQQQPATSGFGAATTTGFGTGATTSTLGGFGSGSTGFGGAPTTGFGATGGFGTTPAATTGFGAAAAPTTGFGATSTPFGAQPTTSAFGSTQPTAGFGATGAFGAAAAKPATTGFGGFGATATSQPATGFGATGTFGATTTTPSLFGGATTGTTSAFGAPASTATTGFGGFGATATSTAPASTGLGFGLGATTGFGAPKPATTSLFGAPATSTAAAPTFGTFGSTPAAGTGTGLFGSSTTGSSLFPATSTATTGTGLFGASATAAPAFGAATTSTGLFGAKPATTGGLFGAPAASTGFGTTPTFGAAGTTQPSSLFGNSTAAASNPFGASTLGGGILGASTIMQPAQPALVASVSGNIYGDNPLFQRDTTTAAAKTQPAVLSRSEPTPKLPALVPPVRFSPRQTQVRLRPTSTATFSSSVAGRDSTAGRKSLLLLDGINDDSAFSTEDYTPRRSVKKLQLKPRNSESELNYPRQPDSQRSAIFNSQLEERATDSLIRNRSLNGGRVTENQSPLISSQNQQSSIRHEIGTVSSHASGSKVEGEYWMSPSLEELRKMSPDQLSKVKDFKVGVPGLGSVSFQEPVDLTTVPSLNSICGQIIQFSHKICVVYPEDQNKPERGQGLNVPALISLENCWPVDRATREPIKANKSSPVFASHIKRLKRQAETEFVDFTEDGTWTFKVRHFSKYGLSDDDEEEDKSIHNQAGHRAFSRGNAAAIAGATAVAVVAGYHAYQSSHRQQKSTHYSETMDIEQEESSGSENSFRRSSHPRSLKIIDPQRQNVMRTALFGDSDANQDRQSKRVSAWSTGSDDMEQVDSNAEHADGLGAEMRPSFQQGFASETLPNHPPRKFTRSLYEQSLLFRKGNLLADAGLMMGRSCRVGWGPSGMMAICGTICGFEEVKESEDRSQEKKSLMEPEFSPSVVQLSKLKSVAAPVDIELERHTRSLNAMLRNTTITLDQNNEPKASIVEGTSFTTMMDSLKEQDHNLSMEEVYAWILGQSLFDSQPIPANVAEMSKAAQESYEAIGRRVRCGTWLSHVIKPALEVDLQRLEQTHGQTVTGDHVFTLLANNKRQKAAVAAVQAKDVRLATLISQSGRGSRPLAGVEDQLALYKKAGVELTIPIDYLKAYALLCGALTVNVAPKNASQQYVTDNLDWRRTFGLHLWYSNTPGVNLAEAVDAYVLSMSTNPSVAKPSPWYQKSRKDPNPEHYDVLFQLIALLTIPSKSLEDTLHPLGISPSALDYRMSWLFYLVLTKSLHISGFRSPASHSKICGDFIFQLENLGLWEWAVFVALHLETAAARETTIRHLLERNVQLDYSAFIPNILESEEAAEERKKVEFVTQTLLVPEEWVWAAKAIRAKYEGSEIQEVDGLLKGGEIQQGHRLIVTKLAPEYILNNNLTALSHLLAMVDQTKVADWDNGGGIYQKYLDCCSGFEGTMSRLRLSSKVTYSNDLVPAEDIKALQVEVEALMERLPLLLKHKGVGSHPSLDACVTEMASRCAHLLQDLNDLSIQQTTSLTDLPLTEDQRVSTIQQFSSDYFDDILMSAEMSAY
ncbi:hypothetical protein FBU30_005317 [Linnemannia zychae]|nr:hypothetical protein FBU30_005317 [Linnemannia zychae]